ncbi:MAG: sugar transferase [Rhodobacterales bacterium]|nr:MAG: sugar transferase [Rhodobacterales bacterium]
MVSDSTPFHRPPPGESGQSGRVQHRHALARRGLDVVVALAVLLPAAPLLLLAGIGVRLSSPGPVLYRSRRVGLDGRPFEIFKLRTMHPHRTGPQGSFLVGQDDARVFALGRVLRKTRIDEVPQLLNVLSGQMALVGPRPRVEEVISRFYTPQMRRSLAQRPGLTSPGTLYQLTLEHGAGAMEGLQDEVLYGAQVLPRKVAIDLRYFSRASFWSDLRVVALTARFLLRRPRQLPARYLRDLPPMDGPDAGGTGPTARSAETSAP